MRDGWGAKVVDRLSVDLRAELPDSRGFSSAYLSHMQAFAEAWPEPAICQRVVGESPCAARSGADEFSPDATARNL